MANYISRGYCHLLFDNSLQATIYDVKYSYIHEYFYGEFSIFLRKCGPGLHYSVDLRIQTYTEPVPLKYGKLATYSIRGYMDIFTVYASGKGL